jgi:methyl-accepting chemotaxis protein
LQQDDTVNLTDHEKLEEYLSVCAEQLSYANQLGNDEVHNIAENFLAINDHLSSTVSMTNKIIGNVSIGDTSSVMKVIQASNTRLKNTINNMHGLFSEKQAMVNEISALAGHADALKDRANDVTGIADQTNLLALNAAIEAARAGEALLWWQMKYVHYRFAQPPVANK